MILDGLPGVESGVELLLIAGGYVGLLLTSGLVVGAAFRYVRDGEGDRPDGRRRRAARVIGKTENVLVFTLVLVGAYTALAVVFAAKGIVTRDEGEGDAYSLFILTGTLVNFTYSVVVAGLVRIGLRLL